MFRKRKLLFYLFSILLTAIILIVTAFFYLPDQKLHVYFFDVGQGDGIFIKTPQNHKILIDGGPDNSILSKMGDKLPFWDRQIDLLVLSHPHADHISGQIDILKRYNVKQILSSGILHTTPEYIEWLKLIKDKNIPLKIAEKGQIIEMGEVKINVLYPFESLTEGKTDNLNNSSLVLKMVYGKNSFLLPGDAEKEVGEKLLRSDIDLSADILKIPHHGSKDDMVNLGGILSKINPQVAVILVGKNNKFGHPAKETLERLKNITIFRTDQNKDIEFICDGDDYQIKTDN